MFARIVMGTWMVAACLASSACGEDGSTGGPTSLTVEYQGTAGAGDLVRLSQDVVARTLRYENVTNGQVAVVGYRTGAGGVLHLDDPSGNLVGGRQIEGYAIVLQALKTGPLADTPSLIFAFREAPVTKAEMAETSVNYVEFRTDRGGFSFGSFRFGSGGDLDRDILSPHDFARGVTGISRETILSSRILDDASGKRLWIDEGGGSNGYLIRAHEGFTSIDRPGRSLIGLRPATGKDFSPAWAGTYGATMYKKSGAGEGVPEGGATILESGSLVVGPSGVIEYRDGQGYVLASASLVPLEDSGYVGPESWKIPGPAHGAFTFTIPNASGEMRGVAVFMDSVLLFGVHEYWSDGAYSADYAYGVGLKTP